MAWPFLAKKPKMMPSDPQSFDTVVGAGTRMANAGIIHVDGAFLVQGMVHAMEIRGDGNMHTTVYVSGELISTKIVVDHIVVMANGALLAKEIVCDSIKVCPNGTLSTDALTYNSLSFEPGSNVTAQLQKKPQAIDGDTKEVPVVLQTVANSTH